MVRAPQPRAQPDAAPGRPRDRQRHLHPSLADRRAVLLGPGRAARPAHDAGRAPRRPAPARRAVGAPLASPASTVSPGSSASAPWSSRRATRRGPDSSAPSTRRRARRRAIALFERRDRPWPRVERITSRRYRVLVSPTGGRLDPDRHRGLSAMAGQERGGAASRRGSDDWGLLEFRVPVDLFEAELVYARRLARVDRAGALCDRAARAWLAWASRAGAPAAGAGREGPRQTRGS